MVLKKVTLTFFVTPKKTGEIREEAAEIKNINLK